MARLPSGRPLYGWRQLEQVPDELQEAVTEGWDQLCAEWDDMYPDNPVEGAEGGDENA